MHLGSNDSVIRGPMITSNKINFYKPKINLKSGIKKYIKYILNKKMLNWAIIGTGDVVQD